MQEASGESESWRLSGKQFHLSKWVYFDCQIIVEPWRMDHFHTPLECLRDQCTLLLLVVDISKALRVAVAVLSWPFDPSAVCCCSKIVIGWNSRPNCYGRFASWLYTTLGTTFIVLETLEFFLVSWCLFSWVSGKFLCNLVTLDVARSCWDDDLFLFSVQNL